LNEVLFRGQRMATELSANNPELIESLRRNIGNRTQPGGNEDSSSEGNSNKSIQLKTISFCS